MTFRVPSTKTSVDAIHEEVDMAAKPGLEELYEQQLAGVWRYVRSRVPDHHEAQDVVSDVFTRALRSWPRYDATRGDAAGWLYGIARHAVADWWRGSGRDPSEPVAELPVSPGVATEPPADGPETAVLDRERLGELGRALSVLSPRDRDALALRFGAELRIREVAAVLGTSVPAMKMILHRAIERLADQLRQPVAVAAATGAEVEEELVTLDDTVGRIVAGGQAAVGDDELRRLLLHLSVVHQPEVPPELPGRVRACLDCAARSGPDDPRTSRDGAAGTSTRRAVPLGFAPLIGAGWAALAPACVVCAAPALWPVLAAAGLTGLAVGMHNVGLALVPGIVLLLWWQARRHGDRRGFRLAVAGGLLLALHVVAHIVLMVGGPGGEATVSNGVFTVSPYAGSVLLVAAVVRDAVATTRLRARSAGHRRPAASAAG